MASQPPPPPINTGTEDESTSSMEMKLSPQCAEKLVRVVNTATEKLEAIWNKIGFSPNERDMQVTALLDEFERLCTEKIADEEAIRDTFVASIEENRAKITDTAARLKETAPILDVDEDGTQISTYPLTEQLVHYEQLYVSLEERANVQTEKFLELRGKLLALCEEFEDDLDAEWQDATSDLSDERLEEFQAKVDAMQNEKAERVAEVTVLVSDCQAFINEMDIKPETELDVRILGSLKSDGSLVGTHATNSCVGIGTPTYKALQSRVQELMKERKERSEYLMQLGDKLAELWELLKVDDAERKAFEESLTGGLTKATIQKGEEELNKLEALKQEKIKEIIEEKRVVIRDLWEQTHASDEKRSAFAAMLVPESGFTDALLEQHDEEITNLQAYFEKMQPILKLAKRFDEAYDVRAELEELQKDKERLTRRGSSAQLKLEEQMAKKIKSIPKVKDSLLKHAKEWAASEGSAFMYGNEIISEFVARREIEWSKRKELAANQKKLKKEKEAAAAAPYQPQMSMSMHRTNSTSSTKPRASRRNTKGSEPLSEVTQSLRNSSDNVNKS